jgi:hypothetical protein
MVLPPDQRLKFFVFVIESPSAVDLYHGRTEGEVVRQAASLNAIPCTSKIAINQEAFVAAIRIGLHEAMESRPGLIPVLHISAHGNEDGIQLSSGDVISWDMLRDLLIPVNRALSGTLLVCMSSCQGYAGIRMAMSAAENSEHPYYAIIGNGDSPTWPETAVGFAAFYHLVANGHYLIDAVVAMRTASGNERFYIDTAESVHKDYLERVKKVDLESAAEELKAEDVQAPVDSDLVKMLREEGSQPANTSLERTREG